MAGDGSWSILEGGDVDGGASSNHHRNGDQGHQPGLTYTVKDYLEEIDRSGRFV